MTGEGSRRRHFLSEIYVAKRVPHEIKFFFF